MPTWTSMQERFLEAHCGEGPRKCAALMRREFGVDRSPEAVRRHGTRMGVSWKPWRVCPDCGRAFLELNRRNGLCPECSFRALRDKTEARYWEAVDNQARAEAEALRYKREAGMYKKRISRINTGRND